MAFATCNLDRTGPMKAAKHAAPTHWHEWIHDQGHYYFCAICGAVGYATDCYGWFPGPPNPKLKFVRRALGEESK